MLNYVFFFVFFQKTIIHLLVELGDWLTLFDPYYSGCECRHLKQWQRSSYPNQKIWAVLADLVLHLKINMQGEFGTTGGKTQNRILIRWVYICLLQRISWRHYTRATFKVSKFYQKWSILVTRHGNQNNVLKFSVMLTYITFHTCDRQ